MESSYVNQQYNNELKELSCVDQQYNKELKIFCFRRERWSAEPESDRRAASALAVRLLRDLLPQRIEQAQAFWFDFLC